MTNGRDEEGRGPVFADPTGRRWRAFRGAGLVAGIGATLVLVVLVLAVLVPPLLPDSWRDPAEVRLTPRFVGTRAQREHLARRRALYAALQRHDIRPTLAPGAARARRPRAAAAAPTPTRDPIVAAFHVSWDDNSFAALRQHAHELDWVIAEWAFVPRAGDSIHFRPDARVTRLLDRLPAAERPKLLAMVTNVDTATQAFGPGRVTRLLRDPARRARAVRDLAAAVRTWKLGGVVIDFENLDGAARATLPAFLGELRAALRPAGAVVAQTIAAAAPEAELRAAGRDADHVIVMLYDEHDGADAAGPVASLPWYRAEAQRVLGILDPARTILAIGTYGYDWNDAAAPGEPADPIDFAETMRAVRTHRGRVSYDTTWHNPVATWTEPDSTDHAAWFLDATTAYDQFAIAAALGARGIALWRLGAEDPSLWTVLGGGPPGAVRPDSVLATIQPGYDTEFDGTGELLRVTSRPTPGRREVVLDPATKLVRDVRWLAFPSPWVVQRAGAAAPHRVALTFDDGPDATWTPLILDTLAARGVRATFFVVGAHALAEPALVRRLVEEGHELGNHSYTHPDFSRTPPAIARLELGATARLLEALTDRRTAFFRPPYFGDAEPTTADELEPALLASRLGYVTAGLHIDSEDWTRPGVRVIVDTVLAQRHRGNVVLLHDAGGDRAQTVAALGPLIDALRARGDTIVPLSALVGLTPDQAMPPLEASGRTARWAELGAFFTLGAIEWGVHWLFLVAVVLAVVRTVVILALAIVHRRRAARRRVAWPASRPLPHVSVIVPAYNEAKVVVTTVTSLLAQDYAGPLEVVVVDDGSPDGTGDVAEAAFRGHPRVTVLRKSNGGKSSALNLGIARAAGEIVVCLDADTVFEPDAVTELVRPFADVRAGAVAGNAKVGNRINLVTRWQALEYVTSQNVDRRAFDLLDCITVVPGAVGAWRRDAVLAAGGFGHDTLAEDQDLTIALLRRGWRVTYAERAVAWTEAPDSFAALAKQRFRWSFGTLQCAWKHRDTLLRRRYGTLGMVAMPNTWLFQLVLAAVSPLADVLFLASLAGVGLTWLEHGATYALVGLEQLLLLYTVFVLVDWACAVVAFLMEPGEERRLTWLIALQRFAYRQVMYWVVVRAFAAAARGQLVGWGKLERKATVTLQRA